MGPRPGRSWVEMVRSLRLVLHCYPRVRPRRTLFHQMVLKVVVVVVPVLLEW